MTDFDKSGGDITYDLRHQLWDMGYELVDVTPGFVSGGNWKIRVASKPVYEFEAERFSEASKQCLEELEGVLHDTWGFCSDPSCACWLNNFVSCDEFKPCGHPHGRCAECGNTQERHV